MSFYVNGAERPCRAQVLACAASYAALRIDNRYSEGFAVSGNGMYHLYGPGRAVSCTVPARNAACIHHAILIYHHGMSYLYRGFLSLCYRPDRSRRTYFRAFRTLRPAPAPFKGHFRLHEGQQGRRRPQYLLRADCDAQLAGGAVLCEMSETL